MIAKPDVVHEPREKGCKNRRHLNLTRLFSLSLPSIEASFFLWSPGFVSFPKARMRDPLSCCLGYSDGEATMQMGICASDLNHIRGANGVDMYHDALSETPPVLSISSHLFLIGVVMIGGIYMCSRGAERAGNST